MHIIKDSNATCNNKNAKWKNKNAKQILNVSLTELTKILVGQWIWFILPAIPINRIKCYN